METNSSPALVRYPAHAPQAAQMPQPATEALDRSPRGGRPAAQALRPYQLVATRICDLVAASGIVPGQRLPSERELAGSLAVSRATLRQALTSLELGGVVEIRSCSGVYLRTALRTEPPAQEASPGPFELLSARRLIEPELAAMAARVATDAGIEAIVAAADAMERVLRDHPDDKYGCELADRHFHMTLARATGNGALASVLEHLWSQRGGLWHTLAQLFEAEALRAETLADYRRIVGAVVARDPAGARSAMRTHLERFTRTLSRG